MLLASFAAAIPANAALHKDFRYPVGAVYEALGEAGFAQGELTVSVNTWVNNNANGCPMDAVVYWANANGKLEGYSSLARFKLTTRATTFAFPELQIIPEGADRLLVYTAQHGTDTLSSQSVEAMLPENHDYIPSGDPLMSFIVLSDTHVLSSDTANENIIFKDMLSDVREYFPDVEGIFINGDNAQSNKTADSTSALDTQLDKIESYRESICPDVPIFMGVGNHDLWPNDMFDAAKNVFLNAVTLPDGSHPTSLNYDFWLGGYHFVFLGDDDGAKPDPTYTKLSDETLEWLDETLAEDYDAGKPTFVFLHQAISNTVAGSLTDFGQEWDGVVNAIEVKRVLRKYPEAILFSGHSHYSMDSVGNAYPGGDIFPTAFNTASLSRAKIHYADGTTEDAGEAQGYVIEVYEDSVLVRGRDFKNDVWKASAQYMVDYSEDNNSGNSNNQSNNQSNNKEPSATKPTQTTNTSTEASKTTDASTSGTDATQAPTGCASSLSFTATAVSATIALGSALTFRKRKRD